jgi:alpha-amylase
MLSETVDAKTATLYLRDVTPLWRAFWFHMHLMAKNLREFADGIGTISDEVFFYHVSGEKNDFARWVQEVIGDASLARALSGVGTKEEAAAIVRERLAQLEAAALA